MCDAAQHRTPFDDDAINVTGPKELRHPAIFAERVFVDALHHFTRAPAVLMRHTIFEVTGNALDAVGALADHGEPPGPAVLVLAEAETGIEVRQIINEF